MTKYYLAVDIGASSGRLILGHLENGKMVLEEVHRFENGMVKKDGELCWEFDRLFVEIKDGLKKCKEQIHGELIMSFLMKLDRFLAIPLATEIIAQRVWMKRYIRSFHRRSCMSVQVSRKRSLIPYTS